MKNRIGINEHIRVDSDFKVVHVESAFYKQVHKQLEITLSQYCTVQDVTNQYMYIYIYI